MKHRTIIKPKKKSRRFNIGKKFSKPREEADYLAVRFAYPRKSYLI